jgi:hypothetical protein
MREWVTEEELQERKGLRVPVDRLGHSQHSDGSSVLASGFCSKSPHPASTEVTALVRRERRCDSAAG